MIYSNWEKIGLAFSLNELKTDKKLHFSHTQCPFYLKMKDEERVYFSSRSSDNISRVFYVKVKYSNLTIKLLEQKVYGPVLDIGNKEDFDSHGVMPSWIIKKGNNYDLYYIGWKVNKKIWNNRNNKMSTKVNLNQITTSYNVYKNRSKSSFDLLDSIQSENIYRVYPHRLFCDTLVKD